MAALRITRVGTSHGHVQLVTHARWQARADCICTVPMARFGNPFAAGACLASRSKLASGSSFFVCLFGSFCLWSRSCTCPWILPLTYRDKCLVPGRRQPLLQGNQPDGRPSAHPSDVVRNRLGNPSR